MNGWQPAEAEAFILANTRLTAPPHVPEIRLHLADEAHDLWLKTEDELAAIGLPPPFWAFAWAGGQGLARYILDNPGTVRGKTVLDFATGSGLVAIAAEKAGARDITAADIDPFSAPAVALNARANAISIDLQAGTSSDIDGGWDVVLAGDVFYEGLRRRPRPWFGLAGAAPTSWSAIPGRSYLPKEKISRLAAYQVPVTRELEDAEVKKTTSGASVDGRRQAVSACRASSRIHSRNATMRGSWALPSG